MQSSSNFIGFWLSPLVYDNLTIRHDGVPLFRSKPSPSGEGGIFYRQRIAGDWFVNLGAGWGMASSNLNFRFKAHRLDTARVSEFDLNHYDVYENHFVFPLTIQRLTARSRNTNYSIEAGARLHYVYNYPFGIGVGASYQTYDGNSVRFFEYRMENRHSKYFVAYMLKGGWIRNTKRMNTFGIQVVASYCPKKLAYGYYRFPNFSFESKGAVAQTLNFIGLDLTYGFALDKPAKSLQSSE